MLLLLIFFTQINFAYSSELPNWIINGSMSDGTHNYVVCSSDGLDPEEIKIEAEGRCLNDAAKLNGVRIKTIQKTIQTLDGTHVSEVVEVEPLNKEVKCEWTDRFLESIGKGYRIWLRCKIKKNILSKDIKSIDEDQSYKKNKHHKFSITILTIPKADEIIISGNYGNRLIATNSNVVYLDLSRDDNAIFIKKIKYKTHELSVASLCCSASKTVILQREP